MANTTYLLKNVNLLTKEQYDRITTLAVDDLYAVETPTIVETFKDDNGNWYRIWSDGWIEQGGRVNISQDSYATVTFLKPFSNSNYYANWISCNGVSTLGAGTRSADTLTPTTMRLFNGQDAEMTANWYACGY